MAEYKDTGLVLAGDLYMARIENGEVGDLVGPINTTSLQITPPAVNTINRISQQRSSYGQSLDSVNLPSAPAELQVSFDSLPAYMLAEALGGRLTEKAVPTAEAAIFSALDEKKVTVDLLVDEWVETGYLYLTGVEIDNEVEGETFIVDNEHGRIKSLSPLLSGPTEVSIESDGFKVKLSRTGWSALPFSPVDSFAISGLQEGTDYEVKPESGLVRALSSAGEGNQFATFDVEGHTAAFIEGATEIQKPRYLRLDGLNLATGENVTLEVWDVSFSANQAADLMSQEFVVGQLTGAMRTPPGKTAPYTLRIQ